MNTHIEPLAVNSRDSLAPDSDVSEAQLIERIRRGDSRAWEMFVREQASRMMVVADRLLQCKEDAADAVQEGFIAAFRARNTFEGNSRLSTWLHRIVVNQCLMKRRSNRRRGQERLQPGFDEPACQWSPAARWTQSPLEDAENAEVRSIIRSSIDQLPEPYRTVLLLRDIEGFDTDGTARLMRCSEVCVKTRLHRARAALRTLLEPIFGASDTNVGIDESAFELSSSN